MFGRYSACQPAVSHPDDTVHPKVLDTLKFIAETDRKFVEYGEDGPASTLRCCNGHANRLRCSLNFHSRNTDCVGTLLRRSLCSGVPWSDSNWYTQRNRFWRDMVTLSLAAFRDRNKPFVVSGFNQPYPTHMVDILCCSNIRCSTG